MWAERWYINLGGKQHQECFVINQTLSVKIAWEFTFFKKTIIKVDIAVKKEALCGE